MYIYAEKCISTNGIMSGNPNKKVRLSTENDDLLWGDQAELTAEECDLLETQATQAVQNQTNNHLDRVPTNVREVEDSKIAQYELEGRIKLLTYSLEKLQKDLNEERSSKQKIINEKVKEISSRENVLKKEVEKMQSIIEFKEQEMKSVCSKLHLLKSQVEKKGSNNDTITSESKHFDDFLKSSSCRSSGNSNKVNTSSFCRRNKLLVDSPRGSAESIDILSSALCTRFAVVFPSNSENMIQNSHAENNLDTTFSPFSIIQLKNEQKSEELLEYHISILKNSISYLKTLSYKDSMPGSSKTSPLSTRQNNISNVTLISSLRDLVYLLSCSKSHELRSESSDKIRCNSNVNEVEGLKSEDISSNDFVHNKIGNISTVGISSLLELLLQLSNPNTYPINYSKAEVIELSLSILLTISQSHPEIFITSVSMELICSLISPHQTISSLCATLKLLTNLSVHNEFASLLVHKTGHCLLCSVATLCNTIFSNLEKYSLCMTLVEDFLSSSFIVHLSRIKFQSSRCISEIIQALVTSMLKYLQIREDNNFCTVIIKKGFMLLHFISSCIPNFKETRSLIEDEYISLMSGLLTLSKENLEFREFYDLLHNMWDFQTDISEFDLEEASEETQTSNSDTDAAD